MADVLCIVPAGDRTGEGVVWNDVEQALYWTDINRFLIHRFDPASGLVKNWFFQEPTVAVALTDRPDTLLVALSSKIIIWQPANDARSDFCTPETNVPRARLNDGCPDPAGYFWVGSMQNNVAADGGDIPIDNASLGRLYRISGDGRPCVFKEDIGISNTLCWSPDRQNFYFADSLRNLISVWDYNEENGSISNERPFFSGFERGVPDGSALDVDGHIWNARYGGGCLVRLAPDGKIVRVVDMPVGNITNLTFGGHDLKTLFITTAQAGSGPFERLAGSLFSLAVDTPGLPENRFRFTNTYS